MKEVFVLNAQLEKTLIPEAFAEIVLQDILHF